MQLLFSSEPHPPWLEQINRKLAMVPAPPPDSNNVRERNGILVFAWELEGWMNPLPSSAICQGEEARKFPEQEGDFPALYQRLSDFWGFTCLPPCLVVSEPRSFPMQPHPGTEGWSLFKLQGLLG